MATRSFFNLTRSELEERLSPSFRATQLFQAVYQQGVEEFTEITNLPKALRRDLSADLELELPTVVEKFQGQDRTSRYLVRLPDQQLVEVVFIPDGHRNTFCISSQAGCALACQFCLTGQLGLQRSLYTGEIVAQVMLARRENLAPSNWNHFNVVFMGMGEPLHNYENVVQAIRILNDPEGLNMSMSRITLSTAGLIPELERLASETLIPNLAISLTGATDQTRNQLMPINNVYPIRDLVRSLRRFPRQPRRHVTLEYVLLEGITDTAHEARSLARIAREIGAKVNLIPLNEAEELPFKRPARGAILDFQRILRAAGVRAFVRKSRGDDISAACGQLKRKTLPYPAVFDQEALML